MKAPQSIGGFLVFPLAIAAWTGIAGAQTSKGSIAGTIRDPSEGLVPGAAVTVTNTALGSSREAVTDGEGNYRVEVLIPFAECICIPRHREAIRRMASFNTPAAHFLRRARTDALLWGFTAGGSWSAEFQGIWAPPSGDRTLDPL